MGTFLAFFFLMVNVAFMVLLLLGVVQFINKINNKTIEAAKSKITIGAIGVLFSGAAFFMLVSHFS